VTSELRTAAPIGRRHAGTDPAVETRPRPIVIAIYQDVLQRIIMHVIEKVQEIFVVLDLVPPPRMSCTGA